VGLGQERPLPLRQRGPALLGIAFSIIGAALAHRVGVHYKLHHFELTLVVLVANVASFAVFGIDMLVVFNRLFKVELEEFDEHLTAEESEESTHVH
jgi:hypothetical protein